MIRRQSDENVVDDNKREKERKGTTVEENSQPADIPQLHALRKHGVDHVRKEVHHEDRTELRSRKSNNDVAEEPLHHPPPAVAAGRGGGFFAPADSVGFALGRPAG